MLEIEGGFNLFLPDQSSIMEIFHPDISRFFLLCIGFSKLHKKFSSTVSEQASIVILTHLLYI